MIYSFIQHTGWLAALICYAAFILWLTYEAHIAPTETESDDYPKIDDFYDHI